MIHEFHPLSGYPKISRGTLYTPHTRPDVTVSCPRHFASVLPFPPCRAFKQANSASILETTKFLSSYTTILVLDFKPAYSIFAYKTTKQRQEYKQPTASKRLLLYYSNLYSFLHIHPFLHISREHAVDSASHIRWCRGGVSRAIIRLWCRLGPAGQEARSHGQDYRRQVAACS